MDFHGLKRKELQALCKEHQIPANLKNVEMADKLTLLFKEKEKPPIGCEIEGSVGIRSNDAIVDKKVKKVRFSPENELFEFTRSRDRKRRGGRGTVSSRLSVEDVDNGEVKLVKKRGRRSVKINKDYCEKRIKVVVTSDDMLFADVGSDEVVEVQGRVTRSKAQIIGGSVKRSECEVEADAKSEALDVKVKGGRRKSVMPSSSGTLDLKGHDNQVTDILSSVLQKESGGEVKPDGKVEAVEVLLRRGRRRSVMHSNWGTLDLPKTNEGTDNSCISVQIEHKDLVEPGEIKDVKVGLRRGRRKSTMLPSSGTLDFAHNIEGANTSKSSAVQVESGGNAKPNGEIQDVVVEARRSRRKSLMPPRLKTFEFEGRSEGRNTSKSSLLKIDEAAGDTKDEQKVPEVVGILKRPRRNTLNLNALGNHETQTQGSGTLVEEHETVVTQNNTRRSKRHASNKSLSKINEFGEDAIVDQKSKLVKRKRVHKPKEDKDPAPKRKGNLTKFTTKTSDTKNADTKVGFGTNQVGIVKDSDWIEAPPRGSQVIGELIPAELSVPEEAKSTRAVTLNLNLGDKSVNIEMMPTPTFESQEMMQDNCVEGVKSPAMEMKNDIASSHIDVSYMVMDKVHLILEDDVHESVKESKESVTSPTISISAGSSELSLSTDAPICYDHTDFKIKDAFAQQNLDPVESLRISEPHFDPVTEMMIGTASAHFDESSISGIKNWQNDHVDSSNELLDRVEGVKLALEGEVYGLAEENIDVTNEEAATELYIQPEQPGYHNETHSVASSVMEMMAGTASAHFDESAICGIKNSQNDDVDSSNELLSRAENVNLVVEDEAYGLAEGNIYVTNEEIETELCSQPEQPGYYNEMHNNELLQASAVSISTDVASPVLEKMTGVASSHFDESAICGIKNSQNDDVDRSNELLSRAENVNLVVEDEAYRLAEENIYVTNEEIETELYSQPEQPGYHNETHNNELLQASTVSISTDVASPVMEMMTGIASSHFDESAIFGFKISQKDHIDSSNELLSRAEDGNLVVEDEAYGIAQENIDVTNEEVATKLCSQPEKPGYHNELLQASTVSIRTGVASPVMEMMTGITSSHFDENAISGIKNSQNDHVDSSNELLSGVEDVNLVVEGEAYGLAEENTDVTNEDVATESYSQSQYSGNHNESHSKELVKASTVSVSADQPETSFVVTINTASNFKVKEPLSCENKIECYSASTRKLEITSQVFEISNTDEDRNEMQLLFATPIKICDNSKVDETFSSKRILENTACLEGSSVIVDSPHDSQREVDEEGGKNYEDPKTQPLVVFATNQERTATGSSIGNGEKLLASQIKIDASFNSNTTPGSSIRKLESSSYLEGIGIMDQHMVINNRISIDKTCEKLKETGSLSEESIRSFGKQNLEEETEYDHELGRKDFHEVTSSLGLLEANRFYLLSDEAALDLFESDTPKDKFPESNPRAFVKPMSPEVSKGEFSCDLSNASREPGEVTVRRVLAGNRFYLLSDDAAFDLSELNTSKDNRKESMSPEIEEDTLSSPLSNGLEEVEMVTMEADNVEESNGIVSSTENVSTAMCTLAESDVMETIQEYIDSESSMSDDCPVDLHVEKSAVKGCEVNDVMVPEKEMDHVLTKKKNARTILIHGTPRKSFAMADKENIPPNKALQAGDFTTLRPVKRRALQEVQFK